MKTSQTTTKKNETKQINFLEQIKKTQENCNNQFIEIKQSLQKLNNKIAKITEQIVIKENAQESYQNAYEKLESQVKTIQEWQTNHKTTKELQQELLNKETQLNLIEENIKQQQQLCNDKCDELNKLLLSFLE